MARRFLGPLRRRTIAVVNPTIEVVPLTPERIPDFFAIHAPEHGLDWCRCVAWWTRTWDGWGDRTQAQNLQLREELFARGELDGFLAYASGRPMGWCQVGPQDRLSKLGATFGLDPDPDAFAITCFAVPPNRRHQGVAHALVAGVLDDLHSRSIARVRGFSRKPPDTAARLDDGEVWTGPGAVFEQAGFRPERTTERSIVWLLDLEPGGSGLR